MVRMRTRLSQQPVRGNCCQRSSHQFFLPVLAMKKEEQELLELSEEKERENETPEKESDAQDFLEDEFDREFWVEVRCVRFKSFVYMLMFSYI